MYNTCIPWVNIFFKDTHVCMHVKGLFVFFDWLTIEQDHGYQLPILADVAYQRIHIESGEASALSQPTFQHKGSFCGVVSISIFCRDTYKCFALPGKTK